MKQYLNLLNNILHQGVQKTDRTGTGTLSLFGHQMRFDLREGFPLITTKKIHIKSVIYELLWFLDGNTNIKYLNDNDVHIWDAWADEYGELGPVYGKQWRRWKGDNREIDQITRCINQIKYNPDSRRIIINAWNVADLSSEVLDPVENVGRGKMAIAPCHMMVQFYVNNGKLSSMMTQRSVDCFLGLPFNIASYSFLTHMMAQQCDLDVGEFIWSGGDCHIYNNHIEQVRTQLEREPKELPKLVIKNKPFSIFDYNYKDFEIVNYDAHPHIKGDVAV